GMHFGHWDPAVEIQDFFEDFNQLIKATDKSRNHKRLYRIGLVMYCHAVEMNMAHHILANLLLVIGGKPYSIDPFHILWKRKKGTIFDARPPSAKQKLTLLRDLASVVDETKLIDYIEEFYNDKIRNSFYHSDYCLTETEFRYFDGGIASAIPLSELDEIITNCFAFYEAFFHSLKWIQRNFGVAKKYHKLPNYELMEILVDKKKCVYGFKMHFSNGQVATYQREIDKVIAENLSFEDDGSVNFFVGMFSDMKPMYMLNGKQFEE
ncbi:MAG: hypothetical protein Q8L01_02090, partial [Candidatus Woesebacteria bacterium]|nr:hypothetical protein [Candidatus Woesebacteria bacterium]